MRVMERWGQEDKCNGWLMEQYLQIVLKNAEWQNELPNPSGKAETTSKMELERQRRGGNRYGNSDSFNGQIQQPYRLTGNHGFRSVQHPETHHSLV